MNCPKCDSDQYFKQGFQYRAKLGKRVQQYRCKSCFKIFVPEEQDDPNGGSPSQDPLPPTPIPPPIPNVE